MSDVEDVGTTIPEVNEIDQRMMTMIVGAIRQLQESANPVTPTTPMSVIERDLKWQDTKAYPGTCDRLDAWFADFECKLKAKKVDPSQWGEKFFECPRVGDELKRIISDAGHSSYQDVRRFCLERDGPLDPVGYFRNEIHSVRGTTRREVRAKLTDLLALHNRAARDVHRESWSERDLIYPFIGAFPPEIGKDLRSCLKIALLHPDPYALITDRAPDAQEQQKESEPALLAAVALPPNKRHRDENSAVVAAIESLRKDLRPSLTGGNGRGNRNCTRCARPAHNLDECPARDKTCHKCQRIGHFAICCRSASNARNTFTRLHDFRQNSFKPSPPNSYRPRPFRRAVPQSNPP